MHIQYHVSMVSPYVVAVRELCEFAAKTGDLDLRFTPAPTAEEGMAGHRMVAARRGPAWRAELPLQGLHSVDGHELLVRGRADGYDAEAGLLEEIKTFRGDLTRMPGNQRALHWAQAKVYGALLCAQQGLAGLTLGLVYYDVTSGEETVLRQTCTAGELAEFCALLIGRFAAWARSEQAHRQSRDEALAALRFPHVGFRPGQRALAEQVFMAARRGRCLMAQAGTGIGKTIASLFPLLKAMPGERLDKLCFLTAKASGHAAPLQTLASLRARVDGPHLRVLQLVARDKACEHPGQACHGEACPLARGFYDKLPAARAAAVLAPDWQRETVRRIALEHAVCPYYLSQELVRWADVVVGDYNYQFDTSALLHGMAAANDWRVAMVVDEAHNLVERARAMYSAELNRSTLRSALSTAPAVLAKPLKRVQRAMSALAKEQEAPYRVHEALDGKLVTAVREAAAAIGDTQAEDPQALGPEVLALYFELLHFTRLAEAFGAHSVFDSSVAGSARPTSVCIRNVVPAPFLKPRFEAARATVLLSATLSPPAFYADMLGLPDDHAWLDVDAPFRAEQLQVHVASQVSTRFTRRAASATPIARIIGRQFGQKPGNYLAFFSSFDYLALVFSAFEAEFPEVSAWAQHRGMSEAEAQGFLARFMPGRAGVGFAVLGGSFAEGVDLPGERCVGAFVATLGLPQLNPVNEAMRRRLESSFGAGFDYAYLYPGIRKVVQAAGRVVRSPADEGVLHLIDERFARPDVQALLPRWWQISAR